MSAQSPREEGAKIAQMLQESQRQGIVGQDLKAFMRIWAKDARLVEGRGEKAGPNDEVIPIDRVKRYWQVRGPQKGLDLKLQYENVRTKVKGDRATVWWLTVFIEKTSSGHTTRRDNERWLLRRTAEGWLVHENRVWPLRVEYPGKTVRYDEAAWQKLDADVIAAKASASTVGLMGALYAARRYGEGHDEAVKITTRPTVTAEDWYWRAIFAMSLYFVEDARLSFQRQAELDPTVRLPKWAKPTSKTDPDAGAPDAGTQGP